MTIDPAELYLDLVKSLLTRTFFREELVPAQAGTVPRKLLLGLVRRGGRRFGVELVNRRPIDLAKRANGRDWPFDAETMIGLRRLDNIRSAVRTVIDERIPGDWIETGVWRGGASIFARACFEAYGDDSRIVWLADSFRGVPKPTLEQDRESTLWTTRYLAVDAETVRSNFARYGLLDERVRILAGLFSETLPAAPIDQLAILRLDGDLYESTMDALVLYDKVSPGGFVIVDDYDLEACRLAITDFRTERRIDAPLVQVDEAAVYWRKPGVLLGAKRGV
jgi:O-methyltransferase